VRGAAVALVASLAAVAHAQPLAALVPATDARACLALGPHGELYQPDGKGAWIRRHPVAIAADVDGATRGASAIAIAHDGTAFRLANDTWTVLALPTKGKVVVGAGARPVAAVGRALFALDRAQPMKLADAPAPPLALAAGPGGVVIATDAALLRLDGSAWKPIKGAPPRVVAFLSERYALVENGVVELSTGKTWPWPTGLRVDAAIAAGDRVLAAGSHGSALELVTLRAGKLAAEPVPLDPPAPIAALTADRDDRVVLATRDGRLVVRERGTWSTVVVRDEIPPPRPGSPPARSK
jgi:hypothetical protein